MVIHSRTDPVILTGERCQCATCGDTFRSTAAFDKHRAGPYVPGMRRCLDEHERRAIGMTTNQNGDWVTKAREYNGDR